MTIHYSAVPGLGEVYLEDSYVLSITERPHQFTFALDLVLRPGHPQYHPPHPDERYCYAAARLVFDGVAEVTWLTRVGTGFPDASGEADLGNIDSLTTFGDGWYVADGDWGRVRICCSVAPRLVIAP
ncbi:hypothetical protein [Rhodococcus triatomae]